ncbi:MAG: Valine--tRNA ligase [candidate division WS2 bacterium]|nr:Valine--tRNA ligase [Candidatus Lithacetigena glycinireducens]
MSLSTRYNPEEVEEKWYRFWEEKGFFSPQNNTGSPPFVIVLPPTNVTGSLHLGHALDATLQDILVRINRLRKIPTLWVPGTDHAGIAAQNVVEEELRKQGIERSRIGKKAFQEYMWQWMEKCRHTITSQIKKMGASCDWNRERFTLDEVCSRAVTEFFVRMYEKGYIYRGEYLVNLCPHCHTAISDIEVEREEVEGKLYQIIYALEQGGDLEIVTTRPETMLGDVALAVHPDDWRYKSVVGKVAILPVVGRKLPIIADSEVDPEFGSGVVKVTPAHDFLDYEMGKRHNLPLIRVINEHGFMAEESGSDFAGLSTLEARELMVKKLNLENRLVKTESYRYSPGRCSRCHTVIEPLLSVQWFLSVKEIKKAAIEKVKNAEITFIPERWSAVYLDWMENLKDWCISRQLWWGHRIPAWICQSCGEVIVSRETPEKCTHCSSENLEEVEDVLDTWFSSALWPFSVFGWPDSTPDLENFYPTSVLVTGYDILTFWVSRMIMAGLELTGKPPFKNVFIHGLVRDEKGRKMSKSLKNVLDPLDLIKDYGTDALRFTLASLSTLGGQDITLTKPALLHSRNFMNKLWNASRYVISTIGENKFEKPPELSDLDLFDRYILSRLSHLVKEVNDKFASFDVGNYIKAIEEFFWKDYCDWYLEISKFKKDSQGTLFTLYYVLKNILVLLHPVIPFITEELWSKLNQDNLHPLIIQDWVNKVDFPECEIALEKTNYIFGIITAIRNIRSLFKIKPNRPIKVVIHPSDAFEYQSLVEGSNYITQMAGIGNLDIVCDLETWPKSSAIQVVRGTSIFVNLKGLVEIKEEIIKLTGSLVELTTELERVQKDLRNPLFREKASPATIEEFQRREQEYQKQIVRIDETINYLQGEGSET